MQRLNDITTSSVFSKVKKSLSQADEEASKMRKKSKNKRQEAVHEQERGYNTPFAFARQVWAGKKHWVSGIPWQPWHAWQLSWRRLGTSTRGTTSQRRT